MKRLLKLFLLLALPPGGSVFADGGHPQWFGPVPPDPLMANRVPVAHSAASLSLRQMVDPAGLFAWEFLKETESLDAAQLRTLVHDLLRPRRYYLFLQPACPIALEAWADRNLAAATADVLNIADWEDRDGCIGEYDSDVEYFGCNLWSRLAEKDFARAVRIADALQGHETTGQCFDNFGAWPLFQPAQLPALVRLARRHQPFASAKEMAEDAVSTIFRRKGLEAAKEAVRKLPAGPEKRSAAERLDKLKNPGDEIRAPFVHSNPGLLRLAALDCQDKYCRSLPFPLLRAVWKLTPEEALTLGEELGEARKSTHWLGWMLFMRVAAAGDPQKAAGIAAAGVPEMGWSAGPAPAVVYALRAAAPEAEADLRKMPAGEERNQSLAGFFARADLSKTVQWLALAKDLEAPGPCWIPLLVRMAMNGSAAEAMKVAMTLKDVPGPDGHPVIVSRAVMSAWAMHDFRAAAAYLFTEDKPAEVLLRGFGEAVKVLPAAAVLEVLTPDRLQRMHEGSAIEEQYWVYLAHEDLEAGFRYFEQHAADARIRQAFGEFDGPASRRDPKRMQALIAKCYPEEVERILVLSNFYRTIAACRPDRIAALAGETSDPKIQAIIAYELASWHPQLTVPVLKKLNYPVAVWDEAGLRLAMQHPEFLKPCLPHMSVEAREKALWEAKQVRMTKNTPQ